MVWLERQRFDGHLQVVFDSLMRALTQVTDRLRELEEAVESAAQDEVLKEPVGVLQCLKGVQVTAAMLYVTELYDIERFPSPRRLMSFVGLTASEHSTGGDAKRGGITKAGCRRHWRAPASAPRLQALWCPRHRGAPIPH